MAGFAVYIRRVVGRYIKGLKGQAGLSRAVLKKSVKQLLPGSRMHDGRTGNNTVEVKQESIDTLDV